MPYNSMISRTDAAALIPEDVTKEIITNVPQQSAVLSLAKRLPDMPRAQRRMPIISALATAYFVTGDTGLKQSSELNWENKYIDAEELACIIPIPEAVLDDVDYDIWSEVRPQLEEAFGIAIDQAVLYGTNIPASWTTNLGAAGIITGVWRPIRTCTKLSWEKPGQRRRAFLGWSKPMDLWSLAALPTPL